MAMPVVAIVGRPNVGKSSLLNALAGRRISIVEPTAGVTRDRVSTICDQDGHYYELIDTGGYGIEDHDNLTEHVEGQIDLAIAKADLILFVVDIREGIVPLDQKVAELLRKRKGRVRLVANKADGAALEHQAHEFVRLGFGEPICVSALHSRNRMGLQEHIVAETSHIDAIKPEESVMTFAVVGKQNVGKSTFINCLTGEERVIVSEVAGTTRDAVDVRFEKDGRTFVAIDTAGIRKKKSVVKKDIDYYSYTRALKSIRRAEIVMLFIDATSPISQVDKKLARTIADEFKPCIIVVNKWDLAKEMAETGQYQDYLDTTLAGLNYAPLCFITASEGKNIQSLIDLAAQLHKQVNTTVTTAQLNQAIMAITAERTPSVRHKIGLPKVYYATQVSTCPPTILLFVNNPSKFDENYRRFMINRLREILPFAEVPIRLMLRHHHASAAAPG